MDFSVNIRSYNLVVSWKFIFCCVVYSPSSQQRMPRDNIIFGVGLFPNGLPLFNNNIPRNNMNGAGQTLLNNNNPNYVNANQLATVRDRMFHAIFHRMALAYARTFPKPIRRLLEWVFLLKVLLKKLFSKLWND